MEDLDPDVAALAETPPKERTEEAKAAVDAIPHAAQEPEGGETVAEEEKRIYVLPMQDIIVNGVKYPAGLATWMPESIVGGFSQHLKFLEK